MSDANDNKDSTVQIRAEHGVDSSPVRSHLLANLIQIPSLIWDFTESNFITFVLPNTAFGVLGALAGPELLAQQVGHVDPGSITCMMTVRRGLFTMAFNWANVLIFDRKYPSLQVS